MKREDFDIVIGVEVHTQLATSSKVWCGCSVDGSDYVNTRVCEICSAQPGTLPFLNQQVVDFGIMVGLAMNCQVNSLMSFDRKNYFYPDLPKGYQITQFQRPIAVNGFLNLVDHAGETKKIGVRQVQIEEDTGKSTHLDDFSLINLNRAGTPLLEIVSQPDLRSASEAVDYLKKLHSILTYLGVSKGNMQDGNFRCDVNLSLKPKNTEKLGVRSEVKNLNSFRNVEKAIHFETQRHWDILVNQGTVKQETRLFDVETMSTKLLREKSDADDYRYFDEPDLPPVMISEKRIADISSKMPELPGEKVARFQNEYGINAYTAETLASSISLANYYEQVLPLTKIDAVKAANWVMVELMRLINEYSADIAKSIVTPAMLAELLDYVEANKISAKVAKDVLTQMYDSQKSAKEIIEENQLEMVAVDTTTLADEVENLIKKHPKEAQQVLEGRERLIGFFVGQMMKAHKGKADPVVISQVVKDCFSKRKA